MSKGRLIAPFLAAVAVTAALFAWRAEGRDVYRNFLDPAIPHHRAILDTLEKLKTKPNDAALHNDLACLIARDGFWRDALREFDTAADLDRKDSRPSFNAGLVRAYKGEWRGARGSFRAATKRDPGNWAAWWMLGFSEEMLGNENTAVEAYKVSLRVDTSLFDVTRNPFAAATRLKSRVLLETYPKRIVRASLPAGQQLEDPDRVSSFFQKAATVEVRTETTQPEPEPTPSATGPVVTTFTGASGASGSGQAGSPVANEPNYAPPVNVKRAPARAPYGGDGAATPSTGAPNVSSPNVPRRLALPGVGGFGGAGGEHEAPAALPPPQAGTSPIQPPP